MQGKQWYEVLLAKDDAWRPAVEDIHPDNYEAAPFRVSRDECDMKRKGRKSEGGEVTLLDVVHFFMQPMPGARRNLRMFDIIHLCKHEMIGGVLHHGYMDFILVPRERVREFKQLSKREPRADGRMPELCVVIMEASTAFHRSFTTQKT